jgi:hypothetical protein
MIALILWLLGIFMIASIPTQTTHPKLVLLGAIIWPIIAAAMMIAFALHSIFGNDRNPPGPTANA